MIINTNTQIDWAPIVEGTLSEYYNSRITTLANYAFYNYSNLQKVSFPNCNYIGSYAFYGCSNLQTVNFPNCSSIGFYAFANCYNLISLYLMSTLVVSLPYSNAFSSTPIGGYSGSAGRYGSIYVPASLFNSYKAATNWSYYSSRFVSV